MEAGLMSRDVAVLGVGMHPWGKWGQPFVEYGVKAAQDALADAGIGWRDVEFIAGGETIRNGYAGDVALVVGADTTPKGFLAPTWASDQSDPDFRRFRLLGATNPTYFALYARRRMELCGATEEDFAKVKVKNARHGLNNPKARYRKEFTLEEVLSSPMVSDPLRLLQICATSDGGAAVVLSSMDYAKSRGVKDPVRVAAVSTVTPTYPNTVIEMPNFATDSAATVAPPELSYRDAIAAAAYEQAGLGPEDLDLAE